MNSDLQPADFTDQRRTEPRVPCSRMIDLLPCQASKDWKFIKGELIDCSYTGLAILLEEPIEPGKQFLVKLRLADQVKVLLYTVQNCVAWEKHRCRIGARFSGLAAEKVEVPREELLKASVGG